MSKRWGPQKGSSSAARIPSPLRKARCLQ
ncbi:hypothetical protein E2I00_001549 [Balaenoptera physalus]|uniref:Uncharacterized protein n=1 Tax=Balaenoptera physalus TaxID=9770 RepID=A0A6A1QGQ1_BALPH|nr:hypothetical protein E2I00_001549 [Balaenoptera physalus]